MKKKDDKTVQPILSQRLTMPQLSQLLACLLSDQMLFQTAKVRLKPVFFDGASEVGLRVLWLSAMAVADKYGIEMLFGDRQRAWHTLDMEAKSYFLQNQSACPPEYWDSLFSDDPPGFLKWLYGECKPEEFHPKVGGKLLMDFLKERAINDVWQKFSQSASTGVVQNWSTLATTLAQHESEINTFADDPVESGAPDNWMPPITMKRPTGIKWLDTLLRGGHRAPEVYGMCGAYGAGKTTLGLQLTLSVAEMEEFFASGSPEAREILEMIGLPPDQPYTMGHTYYFHYEMSKEDIRKKLWSSASQIHYDRVEMMSRPGFELATSHGLSVADMAILKPALEQCGQSVHFPSELERMNRAKRRLNTNFWQIDMTGRPEHPLLGTGYVPEIAAILDKERRKGRKIACVVIDYAMACVERHTQDKDQIYSLLSQFGRRAEHEIGVPFDTPIWLFQQLSGAANARTAASRQHHSDAMGSKRFGENCWFCFNLGTADERTGCRQLTVSKARRADLGKPPVLKIAGGFNRLIDVSSQFFFDPKGKVKTKDDEKASAIEAIEPAAVVPVEEETPR